MLSYDYPGNVRELKNILERMSALSEDGILKGIPSIGSAPCFGESAAVQAADNENDALSFDLREARGNFERRHISQVLKHSGGNVTEAAKLLGITKRQLWNKLSEYEIQRDDFI